MKCYSQRTRIISIKWWKKMASTAITKTIKISDLKLRKEESIYERLQRLTVGAKNIYKASAHEEALKHSAGSVEAQLNAQKDKALRKALLHVGSISY